MAGERREHEEGDVGRPAAGRPELEHEERGFESAPPDSAAGRGTDTRPEDVQTREPGTRREAPPPDLHRQTVDERATRPLWGWVVLAIALVMVLAWLFLMPG